MFWFTTSSCLTGSPIGRALHPTVMHSHNMKSFKILSVLLCLVVLFMMAPQAHARDALKDTVKLDYLHQRDLLAALQALDGTPLLDADNRAITEPMADGSKRALTRPYEFSGPVRLAISADITALTNSTQVYMDSWKKYLKSANVTDETKETDAQKADIAAILTAPMDVKVTFFDETDLVSKDQKGNPVPPSVMSRLAPLIR